MVAQQDISAVDLYSGKTVFVVGLGKSGLVSAKALRAGGAEVLCWDDNASARDAVSAEGFSIADPTDHDALQNATALILSPGVPLTHPVPHPSVRAASRAGVPILGDIELLYRREPKARFVGITGTNGKSTTTALIGHILTQTGVDVVVGGNLGTPALALPSAPLYVLEVSSYQLDLTASAVFDIGVLLNVTPDHLERHGGMTGYVAAKRRIFRPRADDSIAVIGIDNPETTTIAITLMLERRSIVRIGKDIEPTASIVERGDCPSLVGDHGKQNAAAAYAVAQALRLRHRAIADGLRSFPGLAHRQERIATLDGVTYINDSKATNAEATARALSSYDRIYWIAGGQSKDDGYAPLAPYLDHVQHAFLIGQAAASIEDWIDGRVPSTRTEDLQSAVNAARNLALRDEACGPVLLSPACASFDQFPDFEARGNDFRQLVLALPADDRAVHSSREAA